MEGILQKPNRVRTFECTKNVVISKFASDYQASEEIKMNVLKVSLLDPVWRCPVCRISAPYADLIVDEYYEAILKDVDSSENEVELLRDGTWRVCDKEILNPPTSNDDAEVLILYAKVKPSVEFVWSSAATAENPADQKQLASSSKSQDATTECTDERKTN